MNIVWDIPAKRFFKKQLEHIAKDSIQNAEKVRLEVLSTIDSILENPEKFPLDKFKNYNDGSFRAFEIHSLRIAYLVNHGEIQILRVRHVKQEPKES